jgi:hypothetical protein
VGAYARFKTAGADVAAFYFEVAQWAKKPAAILAHDGSAALGVIEAACFSLALQRFGNRSYAHLRDGWKNERANVMAAAAAARSFRLIPELGRHR